MIYGNRIVLTSHQYSYKKKRPLNKNRLLLYTCLPEYKGKVKRIGFPLKPQYRFVIHTNVIPSSNFYKKTIGLIIFGPQYISEYKRVFISNKAFLDFLKKVKNSNKKSMAFIWNQNDLPIDAEEYIDDIIEINFPPDVNDIGRRIREHFG